LRTNRVWTIGVREYLDCAHSVLGEGIHGHTYSVELILQGEVQEDGIIIDFREVKRRFRSILDKFDHKNLNDILDNPTAEMLCKEIFSMAKESFSEVRVISVRVWEGRDKWVELREEER